MVFVLSYSTVGLSALQTLQNATGLELYHLRAALCRQLFDTVFARESTSVLERDEALAPLLSRMYDGMGSTLTLPLFIETQVVSGHFTIPGLENDCLQRAL